MNKVERHMNATVSDSHKYVWFQVAKTGTRTFLKLLADNTEITIGTQYEPYIRNKTLTWRMPKGGVPQAKRYRKKWDNDYFRFTMVRNPWDRLVSFYQNKINTSRLYKDGNLRLEIPEFVRKFANPKTFEEFIHVLKSGVNDLDVSSYACNEHYRSQLWLLPPFKKLDFIGRFENFQEDLEFIIEKIGLPPQPHTHRNPSKHTHYSEYYNDETRQIVADLYEKDVEKFGYTFDGLRIKQSSELLQNGVSHD